MERKWRTTSFCSATLFLAALISLSRAEVAFPDRNGQVVDTGENYAVRLVETAGTGVKTAEAIFLVAAAPESVLNIITDFRHYPSFMPNIDKAERVSGNGDSVAYRFTFKVAGVRIKYALQLRIGKSEDTCGMSWTYIDGDIKNTTGSWRIVPSKELPGGSLVFYRVLTEPGLMVPGWITNALTTRSIPGMIRSIRNRASGIENSQ